MGLDSTFKEGLKRPWRSFFRARTGRAQGTNWVGLSPRRIFILPTRAGLGYFLLLVVLLVGAINYNNNLLFGLTFLLAGLALVAMLHTYRNLAHLQLQAGQGRPAFVGESLAFQIWLKADRRARYAIELRSVDGAPMSVHVPADTTTPVWLQRPARHRGPTPLGLVTVSACFPLAIFYAWSRIEFGHCELAYPAPAPPGVPAAIADTGRQASTQSSLRGEGGEDFHGFRAYHPGDSLRHVYWKAAAREQGFLTKAFDSPAAQEIWLDYQRTPEIEPEARLRRLCRWVLEAERSQRRYGLRLPGREIEPARGSSHRDRCLTALAHFQVSA